MGNPIRQIRKGQGVVPDVQVRLREALQQELSTAEVLEPHRWDEYGLTVGVKAEHGLALFRTLKEGERFRFDMLIDITAVDWLDSKPDRFQVVYQLLSLPYFHRLCVKIAVPEDRPEVDSVRSLWHAANFLEREVWDMYGIAFKGHGDLRRILMYDEFVGHPLRKDYPLRGKQPRVPLRVPELRNTAADMERGELVSLPVRRGH